MDVPAPPISLPRQRGPISVRLGSLADDLDALNEGNPDWWGQDFVAERIATTPPETQWMMLVAEVDGEPKGSAFLLGEGIRARGYAMSDLYVLPAARRQGIGRALVDALVEATVEYGLPGFMVEGRDADEDSLAAAHRLGFEIAGHHRESVLDLDALDLDAVTAAVAQAERAGYQLAPLADDATDEDWRKVYDHTMPLWMDTPDAEGATDQMPFSVFRGFFPHPSYVHLATRNGEFAGVTTLMDRTKDAAVNTFFTGVAAEHRGAGLSTALKAAHAVAMRECGHHRIFTQNMEQNAPILAANDRLGFRVVHGYYDLAHPV